MYAVKTNVVKLYVYNNAYVVCIMYARYTDVVNNVCMLLLLCGSRRKKPKDPKEKSFLVPPPLEKISVSFFDLIL